MFFITEISLYKVCLRNRPRFLNRRLKIIRYFKGCYKFFIFFIIFSTKMFKTVLSEFHSVLIWSLLPTNLVNCTMSRTRLSHCAKFGLISALKYTDDKIYEGVNINFTHKYLGSTTFGAIHRKSQYSAKCAKTRVNRLFSGFFGCF